MLPQETIDKIFRETIEESRQSIDEDKLKVRGVVRNSFIVGAFSTLVLSLYIIYPTSNYTVLRLLQVFAMACAGFSLISSGLFVKKSEEFKQNFIDAENKLDTLEKDFLAGNLTITNLEEMVNSNEESLVH